MTTFQDGPAKGKVLMLQRACRFLRVTKNRKGEFDALDKKEDTPHADEELYAYEIVAKPGYMHVRRTGGGGAFITANYFFCLN